MTNKEFKKSCIGLKAFDTQEEAQKEVAQVEDFYRIFKCNHCGKWHIDFDPLITKDGKRVSKEDVVIDGTVYIPKLSHIHREDKLLRVTQKLKDVSEQLELTVKKLRNAKKQLDLYRIADSNPENYWIPIDDESIPLPESEIVCPVIYRNAKKPGILEFGFAFRDEQTGVWRKAGKDRKVIENVAYWSTPISVKNVTELKINKNNE